MGEKIGAVAAAIFVILAFCGVVSLVSLGIVGVGNIAGLDFTFGYAAIIALILIVTVAVNIDFSAGEDDANERK